MKQIAMPLPCSRVSGLWRSLVVLTAGTLGLALAGPAPAIASASNQEPAFRPERGEARLWFFVAEEGLTPVPARRIMSGKYRTLGLDHRKLRDLLTRAPLERTEEAKRTEVLMELPWPDGSFRRFRIEESPIMEPELAAEFPDLKTYQGQGIADRSAGVRFDWTPSGFHAMVLSGEGTVFIDPYSPGDTRNYVVYDARDYKNQGAEPFRCGVTGEEGVGGTEGLAITPLQPPHGASLRTYRLAVAATGEYTTFHGGTVARAMNAIVTTVNRVNLIYQRDLTVRMNLVGNNASIVYTDSATDPYTNDSTSAMLCENARTSTWSSTRTTTTSATSSARRSGDRPAAASRAAT